MTNPVDELRDQPLDYSQARRSVWQASSNRRATEDEYRKAINTAAETEGAFRAALAKAIVEAKVEHGATAGLEIAKGEKEVQKARMERDVAAGMLDVFKERLRLHDQDRASLHRLMEWSMKVAPDGQWEADRARDAERHRSAA